MDTGSITSYQQVAASEALGGEQGVVTTSQNELGMDDFFKLLTTQLVSQDPLKPMDNTEFISQMATFSSLAQMESIAGDMEGLRDQQEVLAAMNLIGKSITADSGDGSTIIGAVTHVGWVDGEAVPFVGEYMVPYKTILEVRETPLVETQTPSPGEESANP